jgi:hypothetical protein
MVLELVPHAETDLSRRLKLGKVEPAGCSEVGIRNRKTRLRVRVVVQSRLVVEQIEDVCDQYDSLSRAQSKPVVGMQDGLA